MKLKIDDRVAIYGGFHNWETSPDLNGVKGRVIKLTGDQFKDNVTVILDKPIDGTTRVVVHPKQCRILKKLQRNSIWVNINWFKKDYDGTRDGYSICTKDVKECSTMNDGNKCNWKEFIEVRKRK